MKITLKIKGQVKQEVTTEAGFFNYPRRGSYTAPKGEMEVSLTKRGNNDNTLTQPLFDPNNQQPFPVQETTTNVPVSNVPRRRIAVDLSEEEVKPVEESSVSVETRVKVVEREYKEFAVDLNKKEEAPASIGNIGQTIASKLNIPVDLSGAIPLSQCEMVAEEPIEEVEATVEKTENKVIKDFTVDPEALKNAMLNNNESEKNHDKFVQTSFEGLEETEQEEVTDEEMQKFYGGSFSTDVEHVVKERIKKKSNKPMKFDEALSEF